MKSQLYRFWPDQVNFSQNRPQCICSILHTIHNMYIYIYECYSVFEGHLLVSTSQLCCRLFAGFEKQMFKRQSEKRATEAEAYLWSVSDM